MVNNNNLICESHAKELLSKFKIINQFTNHPTTVGEYHEYILRNFLTDFLPNRFSVKTGFIYNSDTKKTSKQIDIIIIDENYPSAYILKEKDFVIINSDAVISAIEVKTKLTKKEFKDSINKAKNFRECCSILVQEGKTIPNDEMKSSSKYKDFIKGVFIPNFYIFSYSAKIVKFETLNKWYKGIEDFSQFEYPKSIYILDECLLDMRYFFNEGFAPWGHYLLGKNEKKVEVDIKVILLSLFLSTIIKDCETRIGYHNENPFELYGAFCSQALEYKHCCLKYKIGNLNPKKINVKIQN